MTAYDQALALARQGLCVESLGGFRRAAAEHPELWFVRHDYAAAILSAVHQGRTRYGLQGPVARSAVEQVAMVREGLGQLDAAEQLARTPRSLAKVRRTRARVMKAWGFAWNAFVGFRESEWADPSWGEIAGLADGYMDLMKEPTRPPTDRREPDEAPPP